MRTSPDGSIGMILNDEKKTRPKASPGPRARPVSSADTPMRVVLSLVIVGAALVVILSAKYEAGTERWAFGAVGTVLGYWLRGK